MRMNVAEGSVLEMELRPSICSRRLLYSASFSPCLSNSLNILFFPLCAAFSSFVFASGAEPSASLNSLEISHNVWGVSSKEATSAALSCAICSLICWSNTRIFSNSFSRFLSTLLRHTKVYLFALDSIFVPSRYSTSSVTKPFSTNINTKRVNICPISFLTRLRKRLMVAKSGFWYPDSQI